MLFLCSRYIAWCGFISLGSTIDFLLIASFNLCLTSGAWNSTEKNQIVHMFSGFAVIVCLNSLAPGRFQRNLRKVIFQLILVIDGWSISCKIVFKWTPMDLTDGKSTLVQVMAWCRQATSHYLSQCWPRSLMPYGFNSPQWVNYWWAIHINAL